MATTTVKLSYYNGYMWHTMLLPDGTRAVWPARLDGRLVPGAVTRYYRKPGRVARRQAALAGTRA